jgi:hypothetical protein
MGKQIEKIWSREQYAADAEQYLAQLKPEDFMESTHQSGQRRITDASLEQICETRSNMWFTGELLVQYWQENDLKRVVPDNMILLGPGGTTHRRSFAMEYEEQDDIFCVFEYLSETNKHKDYSVSFEKYESLKIPYYAMFDPYTLEIQLNHFHNNRYFSVDPDEQGRFALPEIEVTLGVHRNWMRFWLRGQLVSITLELYHRTQRLSDRLASARKKIGTARDRLSNAKDQLATTKRDLETKDAALTATKRDLETKDAALTQMLASLRPLVEAKARAAARQDILDQLSPTNTCEQLVYWLQQLG